MQSHQQTIEDKAQLNCCTCLVLNSVIILAAIIWPLCGSEQRCLYCNVYLLVWRSLIKLFTLYQVILLKTKTKEQIMCSMYDWSGYELLQPGF